MNTYLLFGLENYLIEEKVKEIKSKLDISDEDVVKFNLDVDQVSDVLVEVSTVNMFSDKKLIICDNSTFLTSNKSLSDDEIKDLSKYIENQFDDVFILFIVREEKIDSRKKISKLITKTSKVIDCNKIDNYRLNSYLCDYIRDRGYSISSSSVDLIISKVGYELSNIIKELDKMFIYKGDDKKITKEDVDEVITENLEKNIFELTNSIVNSEKNKTMKIYNDLVKSGEDPIKLIITLSNQFRLILQVKLMRQGGYSEKEIISILKEHPYRINLAMKNIYSIDKLKNILLDLSRLDEEIVTGKTDKYFGFEMFILNL